MPVTMRQVSCLLKAGQSIVVRLKKLDILQNGSGSSRNLLSFVGDSCCRAKKSIPIASTLAMI